MPRQDAPRSPADPPASLLLGCGVVANVALAGSKGEGGGPLLVDFGWGSRGSRVCTSLEVRRPHQPAVTVGLLASGADDYAPDIAVNVANTLACFAGEFLGAFLGAVPAWLAHKQQFAATEDPAAQLGVFSTGPAIRNPCGAYEDVSGPEPVEREGDFTDEDVAFAAPRRSCRATRCTTLCRESH